MSRRHRRLGRFAKVSMLLITGLLVGGSLWLDRHGAHVTGRVAAKHERIAVEHLPWGSWDRHYEVAAAFDRPSGGRSRATLRVPPERYDSLRLGDTIELRYLPQLPWLARTADRSTLDPLREFAWDLMSIPLVAWVMIGVAALWAATRMGMVPVVVVGAAWIAAAAPLLFSPPSRGQPRQARATATVWDVTPVTKSPRSGHSTRRHRTSTNRRLDVPYQVVELLVPTRGGTDTVLAVDAVDSGSVAGLAHGALLPVRLDPAVPREAQLAGGTRRFVEANRYHFLFPVILFGTLGMVGALGYCWRRRKQPMLMAQESPMHTRAAAVCLVLASLSMSSPRRQLAAQAPAAGITDACLLVTSADVEKVTDRPARKTPSRLSDTRKTYSYCGYRDAKVRVTLHSRTSAAQKHVGQELEVGGFDKSRHAVAELGDSAAIYFRSKGRTPEAFLVAHAGTRTLSIAVAMPGGEPSEAARPLAVALARIALARLD